ncbi:MAG: bifunctional PIG-L family deacetylase/class I SAM-dependent methyltransferase [Ornithinimicrobium sp.]
MNTSTVQFTHTEEGTPEPVWWAARQWDDVPILDAPAMATTFSHVVVAAAHPDDETLGLGGLVTDMGILGIPISVLVATAGERSHADLDDADRSLLGTRRRREVEHALSGLAPEASLTHLGMPDTRLESHATELAQEIAGRVDARSLILAPWTHDGHSDHDALGSAAALAATLSGAAVAFYPIWLWHWGNPQTAPWASMIAYEASLVGAWRKRAALGGYASQSTPASEHGGIGTQAPILGSTAMARGCRLVETLIDPREQLPRLSRRVPADRRAERVATFDSMYDAGADPWGNTTSFYEERRRALVLAMLGARRYNRALELGCADGYLTTALADRTDQLLALDTSQRAVEAARLATAGARIERGDVPRDIPQGPFDLIVVSEVGYFLTPIELIQTVRRAEAALTPDGELVLCHWQHPTNHVPLDGFLVHEQARSVISRPLRARHIDDDLCIEVWGPALSVAELEGRL